MESSSGWWRTFFSGPAVDFWLAATNDEQTRQEADFIRETLRVAPPASLLDVPCGGGRHSVALAERGFRVTGFDIAGDFLTAARQAAAAKSLEIRWQQGDMLELAFDQAFDGAYCFGNSFGYFDDEGNAAFLKTLAAALRPGARLLVDVSYITEVVLPVLQERSWHPTGDILTLSERRYDPVRGRLHVDFIWIRDGQIDKRSMSARIYSYRELARLFEEAGFTEIEGVGSLTGEPFKLGSRRLLMSGTKKRS